MALRYDDIEFDTVDEVLEYKDKVGTGKAKSAAPVEPAPQVELKDVARDMQPFMDSNFDGPDCLTIIEFYENNLINRRLKIGAFQRLVKSMRQTPTQIRDKVYELRKAGLITGYAKRPKKKGKNLKPRVSRSYKKQPPLNRHRVWSKKDDEILTHYYYKWRDSKGKKRIPAKRFKILCKKLHRTPDAVKARLNILRTNGD